jgi:hypothetical protein
MKKIPLVANKNLLQGTDLNISHTKENVSAAILSVVDQQYVQADRNVIGTSADL